jgi:hypothetical protein
MYKPNFCAECGERITRARWHFWTSRRFCVACARRLRKSQILPTVLAGTSLFGIGLIAGRSARNAPAPLIIERGATSAQIPATQKDAVVQSNEQGKANGTQQPASSFGPDGTATERPTDPNEIVSICGARTKKGTPCSRRVRGTGRCWQHRGMPAMLPPDKLVVHE